MPTLTEHTTEASKTPDASFMQSLKAATQAAHDSAEKHPFHRALAQGLAPREQYAAYLGQLLQVHSVLDNRLQAAAKSNPAVARVRRDEHHNVAHLMEDIGSMGICPVHIKPSPATQACIARIERAASEASVSLLGFHYVMEGSKNGGRFIAKVLRRVYGFEGPTGTLYFDPYGDSQRACWLQFRADMDACAFSEPEQALILESAMAMFDAVAAIGEDLIPGSSRV